MSRAKILIVDDDLDIRLLLKAVLTEEGYAVTAIGNGLEAFQEALLDPPDLVILDLMMPVMSGADFASRLSGSGSAWPPVLIISGAEDAEQAGARLGASLVLRKPFELQALLACVKDLAGPGSENG